MRCHCREAAQKLGWPQAVQNVSKVWTSLKRTQYETIVYTMKYDIYIYILYTKIVYYAKKYFATGSACLSCLWVSDRGSLETQVAQVFSSFLAAAMEYAALCCIMAWCTSHIERWNLNLFWTWLMPNHMDPHGTKKVHRSWMVFGILGTRLPSPCFPRGKLSCSFREKPRGPQVWCDAIDCPWWSVEWAQLSMQRHAKSKQVEAHTLWVHSRTDIIACQYSKQKRATWVNQSLSLSLSLCLAWLA